MLFIGVIDWRLRSIGPQPAAKRVPAQGSPAVRKTQAHGGASATATTVTNALNTPTPGFNVVTTSTTTAAFNTRFTDNILRIGVNYRFGGPVVARY